jgi:hypothetical protein
MDPSEAWAVARGGSSRSPVFLNRTSFNGALHRRAGPIGGHAQVGDYALDCRFPRPRLVTLPRDIARVVLAYALLKICAYVCGAHVIANQLSTPLIVTSELPGGFLSESQISFTGVAE